MMHELIVDNFAGGGGASTGIEAGLGRCIDIAVNHDPVALAVHAMNHPETRHYTTDIRELDPREVCAGRPVGLAWFSPDCKHFSRAKGGKPVSKRVRGLAWVVVRWAAQVRPRVIMLENVPEFLTWGPLGPNGTPCPARRGITFERWVEQLRALGYAVEWRQLRACDYGAPTIRTRLFLIARCDGAPIVWPAPTHGPGRLPYRTAAECIDWSIPCPSIFGRAKPLAENTLRRIAHGIRRYVVNAAEPFIVPLRGTSVAHHSTHSVFDPLSTISAGGQHHALVAPFLAPVTHPGDVRVYPATEPFRTITAANRGEQVLVAPTLIQAGYGEREGQAPRVPGLDKPLGTVVAGGNKHALVAAFLAKHYGGHETPGWPLDRPVSTVTTQDHHHMVAAFLLKYYGTDQDPRLSEPMHTLTTKHRIGLVTVRGEQYRIVDIGMRMLEPRELFRAQGFPDSYRIDGVRPDGRPITKSDKVRLCGNSVCPPVPEALVRANLVDEPAVRHVA